MKTCSKCKKEYPATAEYFHRHKGRKDGLKFYCKKCAHKMAKKYWSSDKGIKARRRYQLKRDYGLTLQEYNKLFQQQNGKCAICGKHQLETRRKRLAVEHNHKTGKIRGLVCDCCNLYIGVLEKHTICGKD